jgi:hypothetical protein
VHVTKLTQAKVSLDAVAPAPIVAVECELIAAMCVEAPAIAEPGREPSGRFR